MSRVVMGRETEVKVPMGGRCRYDVEPLYWIRNNDSPFTGCNRATALNRTKNRSGFGGWIK